MSNIKGTKRNNLSFETKKQMVSDHFNKNLSFSELSKKYQISYSTTRKNCLNYQEYGEDVLKKRSDNWTNHKSERNNSLDKKDREIAKLRKQLNEKELETEILKKLQTLIQEAK